LHDGQEDKLCEAQRQEAEERAAVQAAVDLERRDMVRKLRDARRHDLRTTMLNQFKQSMAGPEWEMDDYEW
jgi:hypothetical protein